MVACPRCGRSDCLYEDVEVVAWIALTEEGRRTTRTGWNDRALHGEAWAGAQSVGTVGCGGCGWEGVWSDLDAAPTPEQPSLSEERS